MAARSSRSASSGVSAGRPQPAGPCRSAGSGAPGRAAVVHLPTPKADPAPVRTVEPAQVRIRRFERLLGHLGLEDDPQTSWRDPLGNALGNPDTDLDLGVTMPQTVSAGIHHQYNVRLNLLGSVGWD